MKYFHLNNPGYYLGIADDQEGLQKHFQYFYRHKKNCIGTVVPIAELFEQGVALLFQLAHKKTDKKEKV